MPTLRDKDAYKGAEDAAITKDMKLVAAAKMRQFSGNIINAMAL